jgi:hypothetical protein
MTNGTQGRVHHGVPFDCGPAAAAFLDFFLAMKGHCNFTRATLLHWDAFNRSTLEKRDTAYDLPLYRDICICC